MTMLALRGDLETLALVELLEFLASTGKSGCLRLDGDRGHGTVWLRGGAVAAAATDHAPDAPLAEVFCDLLSFETASFVFDRDGRLPEVGDTEGVLVLLDRAQLLLDEWQELHGLMPSLELRVGLAAEIAAGEQLTVTAEQWKALVAVGGGCTIARLAAVLGLSELGVMRVVHDLVSSGLVRLGTPQPGHRTGRRTAPPRRHPT
jgi:hypothetical protein